MSLHFQESKSASSFKNQELVKKKYYLDDLISLLKELNQVNGNKIVVYKNIGLQIPDELMIDSEIIFSILQKPFDDLLNIEEQNKVKFWILADTSYSSCCIDVTAAQHFQCDLIVHFGDACLSFFDKIPVIYSFGISEINIEKTVNNFALNFPIEKCRDQKILLMASSSYSCHLKEIFKVLKNDYPGLRYADFYFDPSKNLRTLGYEFTKIEEGMHCLFNRLISPHSRKIDFSLDEFSLFHITTPHPPMLLQYNNFFKSVVLYDPITNECNSNHYYSLMQRYYYIEKARSAEMIGILVNSLSLRNTKEMIEYLKKIIMINNKTCYVVVVGKPNPAKLANFESIDIWCVIGCVNQGIILDRKKEYFKPILTPYELLLSMDVEKSWKGVWITDFDSLIDQMKNFLDQKKAEFLNQKKDSEKKELTNFESLKDMALSQNICKSAESLNKRMWKGLGSDFEIEKKADSSSETTGAVLEDGKFGLPFKYENDKLFN